MQWDEAEDFNQLPFQTGCKMGALIYNQQNIEFNKVFIDCLIPIFLKEEIETAVLEEGH